MFSQGTAGLLLDMCSDYWDGSELKPLNDLDRYTPRPPPALCSFVFTVFFLFHLQLFCFPARRRIVDFYHRTSISSYCTAFAYRPILQQLSKEVDDVFVELPEMFLPNDLDPLNVSKRAKRSENIYPKLRQCIKKNYLLSN